MTLYPEPAGGYRDGQRPDRNCIFQGDTSAEAMQNIQDAKAAWLETALEFSDKIPMPSLK